MGKHSYHVNKGFTDTKIESLPTTLDSFKEYEIISTERVKTDPSTEGMTESPSLTHISDDVIRHASSMTVDEIRREKISIWKNVSVISLSFMFLFTAFFSVTNLQSTINSEAGLGTMASSIIYVVLIVSCLFVPSWMIKTITCKWTLVFCQFGYAPYIIAQFWPSFYTLIPAAIVIGFCAASMWPAKCIYLTEVSKRYAVLVGEKPELSISRFFGFFFMILETAQIWGNLISSLVLSMGSNPNRTISDVQLEFCGANFCNQNFSNLTENLVIDGEFKAITNIPSKASIDLLSGILLGFSILATAIMGFLLDPLTTYGDNNQRKSNSSTDKSNLSLLVATFVHMKNPYQILIFPLTVWSGFQIVFITAEYTQAFISCSLGVENIGYVLVCYGVCDAIGCISFGSAARVFGRVPIFIFAALLNASLIIAMFLWRPNPSEPVIFFVISGLWGLANSIWQTLINTLYGVIFVGAEEAAFSNYRLLESLGMAIAFAYSNLICADAKFYILSGILVLGMTGYLTIEIQEYKKYKSSKEIS